MSFKKKIKKLFRDPRAFWRDSKFNFINRSLKNELKKLEEANLQLKNGNVKKESLQLIHGINEYEFGKEKLKVPIETFDEEYIIDLCKKYSIPILYIKPLRSNLKWAFAISKTKRKEFFLKFLNMLYHEGIEVRYKVNEKNKKFTTVSDMWNDIYSVNYFDIRLTTNRDIENKRIWIRIEFWEEKEDCYIAPVKNHISMKLWKDVVEKYNIFNEVVNYEKILSYPHENSANFKVDLVFTWVNSEDENWQKMYQKYSSNINGNKFLKEKDNVSLSRFFTRDELKYSLRSWDKYADFINKIYIVSNCKPPTWLDLDNFKIRWVYHEEIIDEKFLPTFSSHAIEANLHKIEGLSKFFIYCNDDVMLLKKANITDFYFPNGIIKTRLETYGMVNGTVNPEHPDYLNAARNGQKLLEKTFKKTPTQLHTHSPQSMRKDILEEMEQLYKECFIETTKNRFRSINDISVASFLYPHFAILSGRGIDSDESVEFVHQNKNFKKILKNLVKLKNDGKDNQLPLTLCLNDGADSHLNEEWNNAVENFLMNFFSEKSQYEK